MAVGLAATTLANLWLGTLKNTSYAAALVAIKLHTNAGDPGAAGTSNAAAGDTTRKTVTFGSASGGSLSMTSMSGSWTNGGTSETLAYISGWDSTSAGNFLFSAALTASQAWASGNTFSLTSLSISLTPIAA
jgi:hypothetical protein